MPRLLTIIIRSLMVLAIVTVYCGEEEFEPYCHLVISVHYVNLLLTHRHAHMHMHVHVRTHVHSIYTYYYNIFGCVNYENMASNAQYALSST